MKKIEGKDLASIISSGHSKYYTEELKFIIAFNIITSLAELHEKGYIHGDIKPEQIMVDNEGRIKLLDFEATVTVKEAMQGCPLFLTPYYAPREVYRNYTSDAIIRPFDNSVDIYSTGIVLAELFLDQLFCKWIRSKDPDITSKSVLPSYTVLSYVSQFISLVTNPRLKSLLVEMVNFLPENRPKLAEISARLMQISPNPNCLSLAPP